LQRGESAHPALVDAFRAPRAAASLSAVSDRAPPAEIAYEERPPRRSLIPFVRCVWTYECASPEPRVERIAGDGCPELIVHILTPYEEVLPAGCGQPAVIFAGQLTRPLTLRSAWPVAMAGVRFEPDGARGFFGAPMSEAADKRLNLLDVHGSRADALLAQVRTAESWDARLAVAEDYVEGILSERGASIDPAVRTALKALSRDEAATACGVSERQMQRRFKDCIGIPPRALRSVLRFRRVFDAIEREGADWTTSALDAGYFDQPQMARDFRRYLGCTAREWARQKTGLAAMLATRAPESYKSGAMQRGISSAQPED